MVKVRILQIKNIELNTAAFTIVKPPVSRFVVDLSVDKTLLTQLEDTQTKKLLETAAQRVYAAFVSQTTKRLQKLEKLFAGMLAKGAAPAVVAKQAGILKQALEKEVPKWEKAAAREALSLLKNQAKNKR